jgi:hypothetical protein
MLRTWACAGGVTKMWCAESASPSTRGYGWMQERCFVVLVVCLECGATRNRSRGDETRDGVGAEEGTIAVVNNAGACQNPRLEAVGMTACVDDGCNWEGQVWASNVFGRGFVMQTNGCTMFSAAVVVMAELQGPMHGNGLRPISVALSIFGSWSPWQHLLTEPGQWWSSAMGPVQSLHPLQPLTLSYRTSRRPTILSPRCLESEHGDL